MIKNHNHPTGSKGPAVKDPFVVHGTGEQLTAEIRKDWETVVSSHIYQKATAVIKYELERDILFYWKHLLTKLGWDLDYPELKDIANRKFTLTGSTGTELAR